ncbi:MAG TPA: hypothetical protein PKX37_11195 [Flexilinea sp.]|nr:hypothetical protein [Flexilinea sp.]
MSVNKRISKGREYRSYRCFYWNTKQIRCNKIDPVVIEKGENEILSEENLKNMVEAYLEYSRNLRQYNDEPDYSVQLEEVERKIENVINAIADMGNTYPLRKELLKLQTQQAVIRNAMTTKAETLKSESNLFEDIYDRANKIISILQNPNLPLVTKNTVLRSFILQITPTSENSAVIKYSLPGISWEGSEAPPEGLEPPTI